MYLSPIQLSCSCYSVNSEPVLLVRPAVSDDLAMIAALTLARRKQLALWEPLYWNPREGIDEMHPMYLGWCIDHNPNCDVSVATENGLVVGCIFVHRRPDHDFLDDFCVIDERWQDVGRALIEASTGVNRLICAPTKDNALHRWLQSSEFSWASSFFSLRTSDLHPVLHPDPDPLDADADSVTLPRELTRPPAHVFGRFDASTDGGLRVSTADGYAIGSAPTSPAAYNPGGPTTVIDRVWGTNRRNVVDAVLQAASRRGDIQVIVIVDHADGDLIEIVEQAGATQPVNLWRAVAPPNQQTHSFRS